MTINDFLTKGINATVVSGFTPGYERTNLDLMLQQARRLKSVNSNYMFDFLQLENDPNYSKRNTVNRDRLEKYISKLSGTTHIMTTFTSLITMANVKEFVPANLKALMYNFRSLSDLGINFLTSIQDETLFTQTGLNLLSDLLDNYNVGNINFNQIAAMSGNLLSAMPLEDSIKNNGLRPLLAIPISSLLPNNMLSIYSNAVYLDTLNTVFNDTSKSSIFTQSVRNRVSTYSESTVNTISLSRDYANLDLTLDDPLGISAITDFETDIRSSYTEEVETIITEEGLALGLTQEDIDEILELVIEDVEENVTEAFSGNLGLPSIATVVSAVNTETYNQTVTYITRAFEQFNARIVSDLGINPTPTDQTSFDYLINLKKNLDARAKMKKTGSASENFVQIDAYLKTVVRGGAITETVIEDLHEHLKSLLKED